MQVPDSSSGLRVNGGLYAAYHCYSSGQAALFQQMLSLDAAMGLQSAAVIWCTAVPYRDMACLGQPQAATQSAPEDPPPGYTQFVQNTDARTAQLQIAINIAPDGSAGTQSATDVAGCSCVPTLDSYPDFQDYMTFLGHNLSTPEAHFTHYIVWNEQASAYWYDLSPRVDVTKEVDSEGMTTWLNSIIDYLNLAKNALTSTTYPVLIYASIDHLWDPAPTLQYGTERVHIGSKSVVDILLYAGPLLDWNFSVAAHPYGDPTDTTSFNTSPAVFTYGTLQAVSDHLNNLSMQVGRQGSVLMAATEQGLQKSINDDSARALWLCQAHGLTLSTPDLLFSTHNDYQRSTGASDDFSLIVSDDPLLGSADGILEYQAYKSASVTAWGKRNDHYCCQQHMLGCS